MEDANTIQIDHRPFFTVIIPNYNHGRFLKKRIESVLQQTFQDFEILIIDDGSTDDSRSIIEQYRYHPKVTTVIFNGINSGSPYLQWQKGIELARGRWVWVAESDDTAEVMFLEYAKQAIDRHPSLALYYCNCQIVDNNQTGTASNYLNRQLKTQKWNESHFENGKDAVEQHFKYHCSILNASSMVFKKEKQTSGIGYSELKYHGDWLFYLGLLLHGDLYYEAHVCSAFFRHSDSYLHTKPTDKNHKRDYFIILNYLMQTPFISAKKELCIHFIKNYLGAGMFTDITNVGNLGQFFKINKQLSIYIFFLMIKVRLNLVR